VTDREFAWPRIAADLRDDQSPADRLASLLAELAEPLGSAAEVRLESAAQVQQILETVFGHGELTEALRPYTARLHHAGILAPPDLDVAAAGEVVAASPFRARLGTFKSVVLARDLSARVGREVNVTVVNGHSLSAAMRFPAVEVFVADLTPAELSAINAQEVGCHVALELHPDRSFAAILDLLHEHRYWELPLMRGGPLTNREINSRVLYVDVERRGCVRRLEFIASATP
jgi:hypothetical protein